MVTAVMPLLINNNIFSIIIENKFHIISRFFFMLAICIPFDIRDVKIDKFENVITIPQIIGEKKSVLLSVICMFVYIALLFFEYFLSNVNEPIFYAILLASILNIVILFLTNSKRSEFYYIGLIDGTMIIQGLIVMLVNNLI
jgi:4-hydroxybenzoate polyprenyltransferase